MAKARLLVNCDPSRRLTSAGMNKAVLQGPDFSEKSSLRGEKLAIDDAWAIRREHDGPLSARYSLSILTPRVGSI